MIWQHVSSIWLLLTSQHCALVSLSKMIICGVSGGWVCEHQRQRCFILSVSACLFFAAESEVSLSCVLSRALSHLPLPDVFFLAGRSYERLHGHEVWKGVGGGKKTQAAEVRSFKGWGR